MVAAELALVLEPASGLESGLVRAPGPESGSVPDLALETESVPEPALESEPGSGSGSALAPASR